MSDPTAPTPAAPPVAPTAPAATPPAGSPAGGPKLKPAVAIGAIVGAVALVGGGMALFGGSKDNDPRPGFSGSSVPTVPLGAEVLDPTIGPQPVAPVETVPLPGPGTDPVITTTTAPPVTEPAPPPPSGNAVVIVGGTVSVVPASGWSVSAGGDGGGQVQLDADSGEAQLYLTLFDSSVGSTLDAVSKFYLEASVVPFIAELEVTPLTEAGPLSSNVVANGTFEYRGVVPSQSGNVPIEGFVAIFLRADGSVLVFEEFNVQGSYETVKDDFSAMLSSVIPTL